MEGGHDMSNKERVLQLIDDIPEQKLFFVIDMLESLKAYAGEEIEPDKWDLQMINQARKVNDGEAISLEEMLEKDGFTYEDLQN